MHKKSLLSAFFLCCAGLYGNQLFAEDCDALVSSCNFETKTTGNATLNDVISKGFGTSKIVVNNEILSPLSSTVDMESNFYGITSNPHQLNDDFIDIDKKMFVAHVSSSVSPYEKLMSYEITGLKPGSDFEIKFTFYHVNKTADPDRPFSNETDMKVGILCDSYGMSSVKVTENINVKTGESKEFVLKGTLPDNIDYLNLDFLANYNFQSCTFGISDIEVKGCAVPKIVSASGLTFSTGDYALFKCNKEYEGSTFEWMMKEPGGEFKLVGTDSKLSTPLSKMGTYSIYCMVDGIVSDTINVESIVSCEVNGKATSIQYIINEDFGYFEDNHKYVDSEGNITITPDSYASERADVNWDMKKLSGMEFDSFDPVYDGQYCVIVPRSEGFYYKSGSSEYQASWFNGVPSDHSSLISGKSGGAALFVNVADKYKGPIYSKQIDNPGVGKDLMASVYIANFSNSENAPVVAITLKDAKTGDTIATTNGKAELGAWMRVSMFSEVTTESPIIYEVSTLGEGWENGNDLIIDDITLSTCVTPNIELYTSETFDKDIIITKEGTVTLNAPVSDLLDNFYSHKQKFLFQQSVDNKNWTNVAEMTSENSLTIETVDYPADVNYFRVVVGVGDIMEAIYKDPNSADIKDYKRNYSISTSVIITKQIPECNIEAPSFVDEEKLVCYGYTYRNQYETFNSVTKDSIVFWLTYFSEYVIKSDDNYRLLWSETENGPWTIETPVYDSRSGVHPNGGIVYYVKQTDGDCESEAARLKVNYEEITAVPNVVNNTLSYYVENQKLVVNSANGSHVAIYNVLGSKIAEQIVSDSSVAFDVKDQSIVILVVDGIAHKVVIK